MEVLKKEYEIFSHMHGDERKVMIFEATNYAHYEDIPLGRFNVDWNHFDTAIDFTYRNRYKWIRTENFNDFHRAMQYMLLSFYFNGYCTPRLYDLAFEVTENRDQTYEEGDKAFKIFYHIEFSGKKLNCYMVIYKCYLNQNGVPTLDQTLRWHNHDEDPVDL